MGKNIKNNMVSELVYKSNFNLHNIIVNIQFYKDKFKSIKEYDTYDNELSEHIRNIYNQNEISDIYGNSYNDYNIIGLNILENFPKWLNKLSNKKKIKVIDKIYELFSFSEMFSNIIHENNNWDYINNVITCNIVYPIIILKLNNIDIGEIIYNKYISKSIIYIYNCKLLNQCNINTDILYFFYHMIEKYYKNQSITLKNNILNYINHYKIPLNISEKFLKFFLKDIDKNKIKIFYNL